MIVHVIPPEGSGGHRHQETFPDDFTDAQVIAGLTEERTLEKKPPIQDGYGRMKVPGNPAGVKYLDHPATIVAVGHIEGKAFIEDRRIRG
jgi:hypothetical protein